MTCGMEESGGKFPPLLNNSVNENQKKIENERKEKKEIKRKMRKETCGMCGGE